MQVLKGNLSLKRFTDLFMKYERANADFNPSTEEVMCAAVSMAVRAIQQECDTRQKAEKVFDDLFGRAKQELMTSYQVSGSRKGFVMHYPSAVRPPESVEHILSMGVG